MKRSLVTTPGSAAACSRKWFGHNAPFGDHSNDQPTMNDAPLSPVTSVLVSGTVAVDNLFSLPYSKFLDSRSPEIFGVPKFIHCQLFGHT